MDLETSQMLRKLTELTEENNKILLKIQKHSRWATFFSVVKWTLFIILTVGSYFAVKPLVGQVVNTYKATESIQADSRSFIDYFKNLSN